jgi:hypothetical protein
MLLLLLFSARLAWSKRQSSESTTSPVLGSSRNNESLSIARRTAALAARTA